MRSCQDPIDIPLAVLLVVKSLQSGSPIDKLVKILFTVSSLIDSPMDSANGCTSVTILAIVLTG